MWVSLSLPLLLASCLTKRPPSAEASVEIEAKPQSSELIEDSALKALLDEHWAAVMERYPEWASRLGDHRYDRRVTDKSLASLSAWRARLSALEGRARALQLSSPADQLSRDLLVWELGLEMARERCKFELWAVSARDNALVESNRLAEDAVIQSDEDAANLVERYRARAAAVRTEAENLSQGAAMGLVESKDSVAKVIAMLREELSSEIAGSPLSASSLPGLSEARRGQLRQATGFDEGSELQRVADQCPVSLRVSDHGHVTARQQVLYRLLRAHRHGVVGEFEQNHRFPIPPAQHRHLVQFEQFDRFTGQSQLAPQTDLERNPGLGQCPLECLEMRPERRVRVLVAARMHVRRQHRAFDAVGYGGGGQLQSLRKGFGAVVDAGEVMTVQVEHAARLR